ncbi:DUF4097 domain-containing protein [Thalassotalea aquiviva]|uniref:DUF4097 family beta strand repeat-containing protein n=1 Tax=Thalassotalea aquiviva TaxID=3242415 RepID=UPI00352AF0FB
MNTLSKLSVILLATVALQANAKFYDTVEYAFGLEGKGQLVLENVNGDVDIKAWDKNEILVTAEITASDEETRKRIQVKTKQVGDKVSVETDYEHGEGWGRHNNINGSVDYTVMVPADVKLRDIDLVNGSLKVENVSGELNAEVVNGSVTATGLASDVEVDSVNGKVELTFADHASNIDVEVETVNGGIRIYVAEGFGAKIEASTGNGSIKTDFGLRGEKGQYYGTDLEGQFGDASSNLELESVNGSIKVLKK